MSVGLPLILHDNRFEDAALSGTAGAAGTALANVRDWRPYTWWKPASLPAEFHVDCGSAKAADYLAVYGHTLGSSGATISVWADTSPALGSAVMIASVTPTNDLPILLRWASVSYRAWQIRVTGSTLPSMAIVAVGTALELPRRLAQGFDPMGRKVRGETNRSEAGHPLGRNVQFEEWAGSISVRTTWSWLRASWQPAWAAHLRDMPFLFAWDPTDHSAETRLVVAADDYRAPTEAGEFARLTLDVTGVA